VLLLLALCAYAASAAPPASAPPLLRFEPDPSSAAARFLVRGTDYSLLLDGSGIAGRSAAPHNRFQLRFLNTDPSARLEALQPATSVTNYYSATAPPRRAPNFHRVTARGLYPGIDIQYYFRQGQLEYDFIVHPGADSRPVRFVLTGSAPARLTAEGHLLLPTVSGSVRQLRPRVYQTIAGSRREISARYRIHRGGGISFDLGPYDTQHDLIIDPVVDLSRFSPVSPGERAPRLAGDLAGNTFLTGFGLAASAGGERTDTDVFVTKVSPSGELLYTTLFGGPGNDFGLAAAVDFSGRVIVAGTSETPTLGPTPGAYASDSRGAEDAFVARLGDGGQLEFFSLLGGSGSDQVNAIVLAPNGDIHLAGQTSSADFPVTVDDPGAPPPGTPDAFVARLDANATRLQYSRRAGGTGSDRALAIHLDGSGRVTVAGVTSSSDFPSTTGAPQRAPAGGDDAFLFQINPRGDRLRFSTLYGGSGDDAAFALAAGPEGTLFIAGGTTSRELPGEPAPGAAAFSGEDAFVAQFDPDASRVASSTRIASTGFDRAYDLAVDGFDNAFVTGAASHGGSPEPFLARLTDSGAIAFLGPIGSGSGAATSLRLLDAGQVEVAGHHSSGDAPGVFLTRFDPLASFCPLRVEPAVVVASPLGGALELRVSAAEACRWTVSSDQSWIRIAGAATGSGSGSIRLDIAPSTSGESGTLIIGDQHVPVIRSATGTFTAARLLAVNGQTTTPGSPSTSTLYALNPLSGAAAATIGATGHQVVGLAARPSDGVLFGVTARNAATPRRLVTINLSSGAATVASGDLIAPIHDLAFSGNTLYGWGGSHGGTNGERLYRIDTAAGTATPLGSNTGFSNGAGLAVRPDGNFYQSGLAGSTLNTVSAASGALSAGPTMSGTSDNRFTALETAPTGELYGITRPGVNQDRNNATHLVVVNPGSGQITERGLTGAQGISAIAWHPCTGSVSPGDLAPPQTGGTSNVTVTTTAGCYWTASAASPWLSVSTNAGVGGGTVAVTAESNTGVPRTGSVTVAGLTLTVTQAGLPNTCPATVSPSVVNAPAGGSTQVAAITVGAGCAWNASSSTPWITFTGPPSGTGNGSVTLNITANPGTTPRSATIGIAGQTVTVNQQSPSNSCPAAVFPSRLSAGPAARNTFAVFVTAAQGCAWSASSNVPWITVSSGASGAARGAVALNIAANPGSERTGTVNIAGQTFTVQQQPPSQPCFATLSSAGVNLPADGPPVALDELVAISVLQSGCAWSVTGAPAWISASPASGSGAGFLQLTAQLNAGSPRSATLNIAGRDFTVFQEGLFTTILYGANGATRADNSHPNSTLYRLDLSGAVLATLGPTGYATTGMAVHPISGQIYAVTSNQSNFPRNLIRLDPNNANITFIGSLGSGIRELAFDSTGTLYGWGNAITFDLYTIDVVTGAATRVGDAGIPFATFGYGLSFGLDGNLYYANQMSATPNFYRVDRSTGAIAALPRLSGSTDAKVVALEAIGNGLLLALTHQQLTRGPVANLNTLNPATGVLSPLGRTVDYLSGIAALNCTGLVSPGTETIPSSGGTVGLSVVTGPPCSWTASETSAWLSLGLTSGQGTAAVPLTASANAGVPRSATVTLYGYNVEILQESAANACAPVLAPASQTVSGGAASITVNVNVSAGCVWTVTSNAAWITSALATQTGPGTVTLAVAANAGDPRTGSVSISGSSFTVTQRSPDNFCAASIAPESQTVQPSGGALSVAVTVAANCAWTASETLPWVSITSGASGSGNGTVALSVSAHTGPASRSGPVTIAGKTFNITQQSPVNFCPATLGPATQSVPQSGGSFPIAITIAAGCQWTAASDVTWASFSGSTSGTGAASITANVTANAGYPRSTLLRIAGQTVRVSQNGPLTGTLYIATGGGGGTDSRLLRIEPSTGNVIADIGSIGYGVTGLAFHPVTRELYAITNNRDPINPRKLLRINIATATATEIGPLGLPDGSLHDLAFDSSGTLYAMSSLRAHSDLYRVDIATGAATRVGQAWPSPIGGAGLEFSPAGTLFYANQAASGARLYTLNPANGELTNGAALTGRSAGDKISGLAFDPYGTLYGFVLPQVQATPSRLVTIDPASGAIATIGRSSDGANSLAFYPSSCAFSLSTASANTSAAGGPGAVNVQTSSGCSWTATSNAPWITINTGASGSGPGAVAYSVAANLGPQRTGTITIAGEVFTITQQAAVGNLSTPTVGVPNPASGAGTSRTFAFTFSDNDGAADLSVLNVLIHDAVDGRNSCYLAYVRSINTLVLVNDAGNAGGPFAGALVFPATGSIANSQCTIHAAGSSATASGNTITLNLNVSFKTPFAGTRILYMAARDNAGNNSGWHAKAVWNVTGGPVTALNVVSMTPTRASSSRVTFTTVFSDSTGFADLTVLNLLINDAIDGRNACYVAFVREANLVVLVNDAGAAGGPFAGSLTLPGTGGIANSQCTIHGAASSAAGSGNNLTLTLDIGFSGGFAGDRVVWAAARDGGGNNTGWEAMATVTVP
jgi:hypothetical protein